MLVSCGQQGKTAMSLTYGKNTTSISSNIYSYYLSYMKTMALANIYMNLGATAQDIAGMGDWAEYWEYPAGDGSATVGDMVKRQAEESLKQFLAIAAYCKEYGLDLTKDEKKNIDAAIEELISSSKYGRSKAVFNETLRRFNINDAILGEIKRMEALTGVFARHAFSADTGREITDEMVNSVYDATCSRIKHILIPYSPGTKDFEGNDEEYTAEEMAAIHAKIEDIYSRIIAGEDFDSFLSESADGMTADGYTIREDSNVVPEFSDAAFGMEIGEVRKVESSYGMHIMKRYKLLPPEQAIDLFSTGETWKNVVYRDIQSYLMADVLKEYLELIEVNREETDLFDIASSAIMFDCMEIAQ